MIKFIIIMIEYASIPWCDICYIDDDLQEQLL